MKAEDNSIIIQYLQGKGNLTAEQKETLKNCTICADLIRQHGSRLKVIPMLQKSILIKGKMITDRQAFKIFEQTQYIFNTDKSDRRDFHVDILLGYIVETRNKAIAAKDFKTAAACEKNYHQLIVDFYGTEEKPDYRKLQPPTILVGFYPKMLNTQIPSDLEKQVEELMKVRKKSSQNRFIDAIEVESEKEEDDEENQ